VGAPAFSFTNEPTSGLYRSGTGMVSFATLGVDRFDVGTTSITTNVPWRGYAGTAALPGLSFTTGSGVDGVYLPATGHLGFSTSGSERFRIYVSSFGFGTTAPEQQVDIAGGTLQIHRIADAAGTGNTQNSNLLALQGAYWNGSASTSMAMRLQTIMSDTTPTYRFSVQDNAGNERFIVTNSGLIGINKTSPAYTVDVSGNISASAQFYSGRGVVGGPAYSFVNDTTTGLYSPAASQLALSLAGTARLTLTTSNITSTLPWLGPVGSAAAPTYSFTGDTTTGIFHPAASSIGFSVGGASTMTIGPSDITVGLPIRGSTGTAAAPSYSFSAESTSGMYMYTAGQIGLSVAGVSRMVMTTSSFTATLPLQGPDGAVGAPAFSFTNEPTSGLYRSGTGMVSFATLGVDRLDIGTSSVATTVPWRGPDGAVGAPAFSFTSETTAGVYRISAGILGFATAGVLRASLNSTGFGIGMSTQTYLLQLKSDSAAKPTSNTWTISSDRRLKTDIKPIDNALGKMLSLKGVTYKWKDPSTQGNMTGRYMGLIAQEVEEVFPEWVSTDKNGYKALTVSGFEGLTAEAVRELKKENEELQKMAEQQEKELQELERLQKLREKK
jgi:hypothetical protein